MGVCEAEEGVQKAWKARGLLQSSARIADFEDATVDSSKEWARQLVQSAHSSHQLEDFEAGQVTRGFAGLSLENSTAAAVEGVSANKSGDLVVFLSSLSTNVFTVLLAFFILSVLRQVLPRSFSRTSSRDRDTNKGSVDGGNGSPLPQATRQGQGFFSWIGHSWTISKDEVEEKAGLDHAMHLEFLELAMRLCVLVGMPCVLILCPLHAFCGGGAAGQDRLSTIGMGNVQHGSWVCWVHAFMVWYVALVVHAQVHRSQKNFLPLRMRWLKEMPEPAVTSVLLQNIPEHLKTTKELQTFFDDGIFGYSAVKQVYFAKDTRELLQWKRTAEESLRGKVSFRTGTGKVLKDAELHAVAESMAEKLRAETLRSDDLNHSCAFVTFQRRREAALAYRLLSADDNDGIRADLPPDPAEVLWPDLCVSPERQAVLELLGYFVIFLVFWGFMPLVVLIQSIANLSTLENQIPFFKYLIEQLPVIATLWNGLMASFALTVALSFLPSLLILIFSNFFTSKAEVNRQHRLQIWYNYFLVVYVLLVTAVGSSIFTTGKHLLERPFDAPSLLASNMPKSTHFYLNFIPMQMASYATAGLRMAQTGKYLAFRSCYDEQMAKQKSEPEDPDFLGMGSRSARAALQLSTVLTFCTLSPLISILGFWMFAVCRTMHGFLFVWVEEKKSDLGGVFWVTSLEQVQQGLFLFVLLMTGVLAERASNFVPSFIAASSCVFVYWSYVSFKRRHRWQHLEVEEILQEEEMPKARVSTDDQYMQPELPGKKAPSQTLMDTVNSMRSKFRAC
ncbi:unnamed protein product [Durusdinium trenchii]|uniref:CSC1/OSCA1-like 7TM region domain-containing protein n=2 Tax=Durusdinium trenchii TaxID=1381693 RepID=A0ABP0K980_9DINO